MKRWYPMLAIAFTLVFAAACSSPGSTDIAASPAEQPTTQSDLPENHPPIASTTPAASQSLLAGVFALPAADSFGSPGFHEVFEATDTLPAEGVSGQRLVLSLWDADRPNQTCSSHHPLSGCATVDWSDSPGRPNVPDSGVFNNSITVRLSTGPATFYLSESGSLQTEPDSYDPG